MAKFLTTSGTSHYIEEIIMNAKNKLYLVSPYLQISKTFYERLKDASKKNVKIQIIYGKDELKPNERNSLAELENVKLFFFENLHAKCYFNDSEMVITSMNMYEFSEKNNREMGVHITKLDDEVIFESAVRETISIIESSEPVPLKKSKRKIKRESTKTKFNGSYKKKKQQRGYCIRCEARIDFDPTRPYCWDCYTTWSQFENPLYQENVCHSCGEFENATMEKPVCYSCYKELEKVY